MPRSVYPKSRKEDIDDAVMNSEYNDKYKKVKEKESNMSKVDLDKIREGVLKLREIILQIDPNLEVHLSYFRDCYAFLKKLKLV